MKHIFFKNAQQMKDKRRRFIFSKNEILCASISLLFESNFSKPRINEKIATIRFNHSFKNRCLVTGRGNSIFKEFRLSRVAFREKASNGLLSGIKRSTW